MQDLGARCEKNQSINAYGKGSAFIFYINLGNSITWEYIQIHSLKVSNFVQKWLENSQASAESNTGK